MSIQNGISKFKILQNIFIDKISSDPFTLQFTAGIKLLNSELLKNSMASRQIQAIFSLYRHDKSINIICWYRRD